MLLAAWAVLLVPAAAARGQDGFTLLVDHWGPGFLTGKAGETIPFQCYAGIDHAGLGSGAQAWSFGVAVEGAALTTAVAEAPRRLEQ